MSGSLSVAWCCNDPASGYERPSASALRQVREEDEFYIPDFTRTGAGRSRPDVYAAANDHARHLREAEGQLADALNLARVLRGSVQQADDAAAVQADTVLKIVEKKLRKANRALDRHDTRHLNLFMAYFDLKDRCEPGGSD